MQQPTGENIHLASVEAVKSVYCNFFLLLANYTLFSDPAMRAT
jgi:hypothetical protein